MNLCRKSDNALVELPADMITTVGVPVRVVQIIQYSKPGSEGLVLVSANLQPGRIGCYIADAPRTESAS